jgi:hypothetical protein
MSSVCRTFIEIFRWSCKAFAHVAKVAWKSHTAGMFNKAVFSMPSLFLVKNLLTLTCVIKCLYRARLGIMQTELTDLALCGIEPKSLECRAECTVQIVNNVRVKGVREAGRDCFKSYVYWKNSINLTYKLPYSQENATDLGAVPDQFTSFHSVSLRCIFVLLSNLHLGLPNCFLHSVFQSRFCAHFCLSLPLCYMLRPLNPLSFAHANSICPVSPTVLSQSTLRRNF